MTSSPAAFDVHIAGFGVHTPFGFGQARLLEAITKGESAPGQAFLQHPFEVKLLGFDFNPHVIRISGIGKIGADRLPYPQLHTGEVADSTCKVIVDALEQAAIPMESLACKRVSVFFGGPGMQPEGANFLFHINRNDQDDLASRPGIGELNFDNHDQDTLARQLRDGLGLKTLPISVFAASSSGLAAAYLAYCAIKANHFDVAIAVSFQRSSLFDLIFMNGFGGLSRNGKASPFSAHDEGTILGDGICAMVLESASHLHARQGIPYAALDSLVMCQSAGAMIHGAGLIPDFRIIGRSLEKALEQAGGLCAEDIGCVFPHGNGMRSSDRAEALALKKYWGALETPVVSYKSQTGYLLASSALVDLAIMAGCLESGRLPAFQCEGEVDNRLGIHLHANADARTLTSPVGLKIGLGVEGSVGVAVIRSLRQKNRTIANVAPSPPACPPPHSASVGIYGLSLMEPAAHHTRTFVPKWYNAREERAYRQACKARAKSHWPLTRFGGGALGSATAREISFALELSSRTALEEGRKHLEDHGRLDKQRLALLYFDAWGQSSYLEPAGSWKDSFSIDVIPWKLLKEFRVGAFSCKIRAGHTAFVDALHIAAHLFAADMADTALVGGLFRFHPVLGFSAVTAAAKAEQHWLGQHGSCTAPVIERAGFVLLGPPPLPSSNAIRTTLLPACHLPTGLEHAASQLGQHLTHIAPAVSTVIGGLSPSSALIHLEASATLAFNAQAQYINTTSLYGDSGGINPLLALSHYRKLRRPQGGTSAVLCMENAHGDAHALVLE